MAPFPSATVAEFATVSPLPFTFRLEATGRVVPAGYAVR